MKRLHNQGVDVTENLHEETENLRKETENDISPKIRNKLSEKQQK